VLGKRPHDAVGTFHQVSATDAQRRRLGEAWRTSRDWRGIAAILVSWAVRGVMIALRFAASSRK
jgi:hypothetical protein